MLTERQKQIETAIAVASGHAFVPAAVRVGLAAMAGELRDLRAGLTAAEARIFQLQGDVLLLKRGGGDGKR